MNSKPSLVHMKTRYLRTRWLC